MAVMSFRFGDAAHCSGMSNHIFVLDEKHGLLSTTHFNVSISIKKLKLKVTSLLDLGPEQYKHLLD